MITKKGIIKKVPAVQFQDVRRGGIIAIRLKKDDELDWARVVSASDHLVLVSKKGQAIRFKESDVRSMGRTAAGVRAINLKAGDELVGADVVSAKEKEADLLVLSEKGFGKKTKMKEYRIQKRGGTGIKTAKITDKTGPLVAAKVVGPDFEEIIAISKKGQILKTKLTEIATLGRQTQGVRVMRLKGGDSIASLTCL
jgi:DNA gyrase subunit A